MFIPSCWRSFGHESKWTHSFCLWGSDSARGAAFEWFGRCHWKNFDAHVGLQSARFSWYVSKYIETNSEFMSQLLEIISNIQISNHIRIWRCCSLGPQVSVAIYTRRLEIVTVQKIAPHFFVEKHIRSKFQSSTNSKFPVILPGYFWVSCFKLRKTVVVLVAFPPTLWMGSRLDGKPSPICVQYPEFLQSLEFSLFFLGLRATEPFFGSSCLRLKSSWFR